MKFNWKPCVQGTLALALLLQPVLAQAVVIQLPKEVKVNYPKEFKEKIEDIKICLSEAEKKIYESTENSDVTTDINCESMIDKYELGGSGNVDQDDLKDDDSPYLKETRELRIAMEMYLKLNEDMHGEVAEKQTPDDMVDQVLYRIFNLLYELPKVQGHPMIIEFVRDVRDSFLNVIRSEYFKSVVYFFYYQNPDKELTTDLLRFVYHIEQAENAVTDGFVPDEDMVVEPPISEDAEVVIPESQLPELTPDEQAKEDLDFAWEQEIEKIEEEEQKENPQIIYQNEEPRIEREVYISYEVVNDVCMKITETYVNNKYQGKTSVVSPKSEAYNCGRLEDIDWGNEVEEETVDSEQMIFYRYGEEEELLATNIELEESVFDYELLVDVFRMISSEHGAGSLGGEERYLFAIAGKSLILDNFEEVKALSEVNEWLSSKKIPIQLVVETLDEVETDSEENTENE